MAFPPATVSVAAQICFALWFSFGPAAASPLGDLVDQLDAWIDANTDLPRAAQPPRIRIAAIAEPDEADDRALAIGKNVRGLYDPATRTITLVRPWSPSSVRDASVLLHELVHHRQAARHYYCPAAQELDAYKVQKSWLLERDETLDVNWVGVVLASSCAPRDIHPD